jgi:hypothetical protein
MWPSRHGDRRAMLSVSSKLSVPKYWALGAITLLAFGLRIWSLGYGLPGIFNMDEKPILDRALTFAKGDPNPHNFLYPTLYLYALFAWEGLYFLVGRATGLFHSLGEFRNAYFVDASGHFLAARALTALFGTATIAAVYWYGSRLFDRSVGLAAALFLAVAPMAVRDAHYVKLDVPVAFFAVLAHAALAQIVVDGRGARRAWLIAGVFAGLAISTQYYAVFLAVPFLAAAAVDIRRSGRWQVSAGLLLWAGLATVAAFVATSPFFLLEPSTVARDFRELRAVDLDRAVGVGLFSSFPAYAKLLFGVALGYPIFLLGVLGGILALSRDWPRGLLLTSFPLVFIGFVSNTFPASRYLNIVLPCFAVAAAYAAARIAERAGARRAQATVAICLLASVPALSGSMRWDLFFGQDDTRTLAARFIEREVPTGSTILVQPYSAPIRQSREGLIEALRASLGEESRAPMKFQLQLQATAQEPTYRVLYVGEGGKTQAPPGDLDKIYISPRAFTSDRGLRTLRAARVEYVVLTRYGGIPPALAALRAALDREARRVATFSPYRDDLEPASAPVPPFRHNGNTGIHPVLARPGPVVEIWRIE